MNYTGLRAYETLPKHMPIRKPEVKAKATAKPQAKAKVTVDTVAIDIRYSNPMYLKGVRC